jgi:hypothetical protein
MKKNILFWISIFFVGFAASAQVNVTGAQGMSVTTLLEQYFSGGGVEIFNGKFNGQTTINSNAIATFSNGATNTPNMPVAGGILMTTGAYTDAGVGSSSGIVSSSISPASDGDDVSPALRIAL